MPKFNGVSREETAKYNKLGANTLLLAMGTFASKLLVFFLMPLYTSILSSAQYGVADIISQSANLIIPIASVGIYNGVFRFAADKAEDKRTVLSSALASLLIGLGVFLLLSPLLGLITYISEYVWLLVLYVVAAGVHYVCSYYLRAIDKTRLFAIQGIFNTLMTIALNVLFLVVFEIGIVGYVLSVVIANVLTIIFIFVFSGIGKDISFGAVKKSKMGELLRYSIPLIPATVIWWITDVSDRYLVTYFRGSAENGLYSASYKIPTLITLLAGIFIEAWQFSAINEKDDEKGLESFYSTVFEAFMGVVFVSSCALIFASKLSARVLFDQSYFEAWRYVPTLLVATVFMALVSFFGTVYMVKKKSVLSFFTAILGALINVVLNILLIPKYGPLGAAFATAVCYFTVFIIRMINSVKYIRFKLPALRLALNSLLIVAAALIMTVEISSWVLYEGAILAVLIAINIAPIWRFARIFFSGLLRKIKK